MTISLTGPSTVLTDASSTFVNNIYASPQALTFDFTGANYMYMQTYTFNTFAFFQITGDALSYSSNSDSFYIKVEDYCEREAVITDPLISTQNTYFVSQHRVSHTIPIPDVTPTSCYGINAVYSAVLKGQTALNDFITFDSTNNILSYYTNDTDNAGSYTIVFTYTITQSTDIILTRTYTMYLNV